MGKISKVFFIHSHHIIVQISQFTSISTMDHSRSFLFIIKLRRKSVVNKTTAVRINTVGIGVVGVGDVTNAIVFSISSFDQYLFIILGGFDVVSSSRLEEMNEY